MDFIEEMELMRGKINYNYSREMAKDFVRWMWNNAPVTAKALENKSCDKGTIYENAYSRFACSDDWKYLGLKARYPLRQWQYKDMVKRAGPAILEQACENSGVSRGLILNAIFADDWQRLDELIRYDQLSKAIGTALDEIWNGGKKKCRK